MNNFREAEIDLKECTNNCKPGHDTEIRYKICHAFGELYLKWEDYEKAEKWLREKLLLKKNEYTDIQMARLLYNKRNFSEAEKFANRATKADDLVNCTIAKLLLSKIKNNFSGPKKSVKDIIPPAVGGVIYDSLERIKSLEQMREYKQVKTLLNIKEPPALIVGAGISVDFPSCFPTVSRIYDSLNALIIDADMDSLKIAGKSIEDVKGIFMNSQFESVLQAFKTVIGYPVVEFFKLFDTSSSSREKEEISIGPNEYHKMASRYLDMGCVVISTNFDTFIEEAFKSVGCKRKLKVLVTDRDYQQFLNGDFDSGKFALLMKIHGCVKENSYMAAFINRISATSDATIALGMDIDSESVRLNKLDLNPVSTLSIPKSRVLQKIFGENDIAIIGYSMCDKYDIVPLLHSSFFQNNLYYFEYENESKTISEFKNINVNVTSLSREGKHSYEFPGYPFLFCHYVNKEILKMEDQQLFQREPDRISQKTRAERITSDINNKFGKWSSKANLTKGDSLNILGNLAYYSGYIDQAKNWLKLCKKVYEKNLKDDTIEEKYLNLFLSLASVDNINPMKFVPENYFELVFYMKEDNLQELYAKIYALAELGISRHYMIEGDMLIAADYLNSSKERMSDKMDLEYLAEQALLLGHFFLKKKEYKEAVENFQRAWRIYGDFLGLPIKIIQISGLLLHIYSLIGFEKEIENTSNILKIYISFLKHVPKLLSEFFQDLDFKHYTR